MRTLPLFKSFLLVAVLTGALHEVRAQQAVNVTITLHENGQGIIENTAGFHAVVAGMILPDPGPGGLSAALTFDLLGPPGLVGGDVFLLDSNTGTSDIIRFNLAGTGDPNYLASAVFYSLINDSGENQLADTGFPTANYSSTITLPENQHGPTTYTPALGQPGYVADASGSVGYVFFSSEPDRNAVPETGTSAVLFGSALLAMGCFACARGAAVRRSY